MFSTTNTFLVFMVLLVVTHGEYAGPTGPYPAAGYPPASSPAPTAQGPVDGGVVGGTGVGGFGGPFIGGPFFGGFPPIPPPFPPVPFSPICAALEGIRIKVAKLTQPLLIGGLGAVFFWVLKALLIPQIGVFASTFNNLKRRMDGDDVLDRVTNEVARALSDGVCTERIACSLGFSARKIPGAKAIARIIGSEKIEEQSSFINIFKNVAVGKQNDCHQYSCLTRDSYNDNKVT